MGRVTRVAAAVSGDAESHELIEISPRVLQLPMREELYGYVPCAVFRVLLYRCDTRKILIKEDVFSASGDGRRRGWLADVRAHAIAAERALAVEE